MTTDPLDDLLSSLSGSDVRTHKKMMAVLREAYTCGVPALMAKSITDRLKQAGGYSFYLGTPPDELRRIASFVLTIWNDRTEDIPKLLQLLWKRGGKEDAQLYGILLANLDPRLVAGDMWGCFADVLGSSEPTDSLLSVCEELARAGHALPSSEMIVGWADRSKIHHQLAVFLLFMRGRQGTDMSDSERRVVEQCPEGSELASRVRRRLLDA